MSLSQRVAAHLPYLRRYARALTGSQSSGDAYVRACLQTVVADPRQLTGVLPLRIALYRVFHAIWETGHVEGANDDAGGPLLAREMTRRLGSMTPARRKALLLTAMEGFSYEDAGLILGVTGDQAKMMAAEAIAEMAEQDPTTVLIIEDEPIISLDLRGIVEGMGHRVLSVATTRAEAVAAACKTRPGLVLADIQLADGSSGLDAAKDILADMPAPVVFITAYPERLLTGERPEPTFLVTKPFLPETVKAAVSQALFLDAALRSVAA